MRTTRRMRRTGRKATLLLLRFVISTLTMERIVIMASNRFQLFPQKVPKPTAMSLHKDAAKSAVQA